VLGLLIVTSVLAGGMALAGVCQRLFTPNIDVFYMVWLWFGLIPFWWILGRTMPERIPHPTATYVSFLPFLLISGFLLHEFGANNRWIIVVLAAAFGVYFSIAERLMGATRTGSADDRVDSTHRERNLG
jgi:hypothetical protein